MQTLLCDPITPQKSAASHTKGERLMSARSRWPTLGMLAVCAMTCASFLMVRTQLTVEPSVRGMTTDRNPAFPARSPSVGQDSSYHRFEGQVCPSLLASISAIESSPLCGTALLQSVGVDVRTTLVEATESRVIVTAFVEGKMLDDVYFVARAVGPTIRRGLIIRTSNCSVLVTFAGFSAGGRYDLDILATWVGSRYIGQNWHLPDRNDNPSFAEKKRKCLALNLTGACDRFGSVVFAQSHLFAASMMPRSISKVSPIAIAGGGGSWHRMTAEEAERHPLLVDDVGLNDFNGSRWRWVTDAWGASFAPPTRGAVSESLKRQKIRSIAIFGDSMMVEMFNMFAAFFDARSSVSHGKYKKLRFMEFTTDQGLRVRFSRSYTTSQGTSVLASPATIVRQLELTRPDVIIGNLAVLHWQQNMRPLSAWTRSLSDFHETVIRAFPSEAVKKIYVGHTLIQMGRTQGLNPSRTEAFSQAARLTLTQFEFFDPLELSHSRREAAFDGQHWACYHMYGGVSMSITHLLLAGLCGGPSGLG